MVVANDKRNDRVSHCQSRNGLFRFASPAVSSDEPISGVRLASSKNSKVHTFSAQLDPSCFLTWTLQKSVVGSDTCSVSIQSEKSIAGPFGV